MRKLYLILMSLFGVLYFTACETDNLPTPEEVGEEDLSYLYYKNGKYDVVGYTYQDNSKYIFIKQTAQRHLTYDGYKVVKENFDELFTQYDKDGQTDSQYFEEEINYTYDGLMCTLQYSNDATEKIEYLDDTYLRIKTRESGDEKYVREYDGKKIVKESYYSDDKLIYEINYEYEGLNATYTYTHHIFVDNAEIGAWTQQVGGKISYLDETYLRVTYEERDFINEYGDNFKEVVTKTYDGKKCIKEEMYLQGSWNGYSFNNALREQSEYEYNGLKCNGKHTTYLADPQPPFNEFFGEINSVETMELEYLM